MPNRLAGEQSPYLLQHASNPVDWFPWGEDAFAKARAEDKPVMLSVGYATCHWCHVMAHECFQDQEVAALLNRHFVAVKVDREERPDIDSAYMSVCQALTGAGGWPLTVFLTPEKKPFYAGTYFPKHTAMGRPGMVELLTNLARLWREERQRLLTTGEEIAKAMQPQPAGERQAPGQKAMEKAYWTLARGFDQRYGGFGQAPKFPTPHQLNFLLRWQRRAGQERAGIMAAATLMAMRQGGIFDQIGYGFHRYSVDQKWLVPHFEKMLYDQALLALAYLEAFQATGEPLFARTAREIFSYVLRDMTSPQGAFYSAEDADSEGAEGTFYLWTPEQVRELLGEEEARLFCRYYGVTAQGNFEGGKSVLHITRGMDALAEGAGLSPERAAAALDEARAKLLAARAGRPRPLLDDKVLTAWNGLMIAALARGALVLGEPAYQEAADRAARFVMSELGGGEGRLLRRWREGHAAQDGFLEDYAFMAWGLIELYQASLDPEHLESALALARAAGERFEDQVRGGFFFTAHDGEELFVREKGLYDGAVPSGNSVMAFDLLRLSRLTGDTTLERSARRALEAFGERINEQPSAFTMMLQALDFALGPTTELVIAGQIGAADSEALLAAARRRYDPLLTVLLCPPGEAGRRMARIAPFCAEMNPKGGKAAAYLCRGFACQAPTTDPDELERQLAAGP